MANPTYFAEPRQRLLSLDFMRGFIMILLILEGTGLFEKLDAATAGTGFNVVVQQFFHHPWNGLRFWDLVQPGFMFIAGAAMAYSLHRQQEQGVPWRQSFIKILKRSALLLFWGIWTRAVKPEGLNFELWNVLAQLAFTTLMAFLIFSWSIKNQILFSLFLLVLTEILYRFTNVSGFNQPFTDQHNFGNYIDLLLVHKISKGGWVTINFIPTACHTIWGMMAGSLLLSNKPAGLKLKWLMMTGIILLALGYINGATLTPIVKRIATSSFVLVSGGWCLVALAFLYWWNDIKGHTRYAWIVTVVGMNSLFIYLFIETISGGINEYVNHITIAFLTPTHLPVLFIGIIASALTFLLEWFLCWYMFRKKVFIKI
ncbi:acyltransferase family protein [Mucilaginibacter angelicae]|uniref:Acyltransferase family protein n=1 Tax=Mucilaginibacter angelicae TaxID=869718 RepID=A0ABV6L1X6_9SPHI